MISFREISKSFPRYLRYSNEQLNGLSRKAYSKKSDSSSSSSSSDSDSDKTNEKKKKPIDKAPEEDLGKAFNISNTNARLNALLEKVTQAQGKRLRNEPQKPAFNIAIKPRKERFKEDPDTIEPKKSFEEELKGAAKDVAKSLGGDTKKTESELLSQVLNIRREPMASTPSQAETSTGVTQTDTAPDLPQAETPVATGTLDDLLAKMTVEEVAPVIDIRELKTELPRKRMMKDLDKRLEKPSVASSILSTKVGYARKKLQQSQKHSAPQSQVLKNHQGKLGMFTKTIGDGQSSRQLTVWETLYQKELNLAMLTTPQNVFEELIQWTEQGKLWHFPINNEQGLKGEENVHFSEHVFLDKHLKDWCPKRGPIRHFMDLVCIGLSKNPYMTVEEKTGHIMWYRDYFEDKKDLLNELGLLDDKLHAKSKGDKKEQIEA
ncbi:hypothetical protein QAD02_000921 [Eretmocerus hayati]|uniref:Uncharacterized protein n=1 Tax=Eretmocerus hayati TaxID=131215 RepID=A0ACC2NES5_9HYME|nr:hypothetical protein QAD02_000921 [Eretmocerus hayati]